MALFVLGSVIAGLAGSAGVLIVARVVQGIGGSAILPSTLSSVNSLFQGDDRAAAFGVWGAVMAGAAAVGPLAGGLLTEYAGWRWIFWVNVPIGVLLFVLALKLVPNTKGRSDAGHDVAGFLLSAIGFGLLVFAIIQGPKMGWWPWPGLAGIVGAVAVAAFVALENRRCKAQDAVLLDIGLFQVLTFTWGNITALMVAVGEFALIFVLPLYLINALGAFYDHHGLVLAAMAAGAFLSGALARHLAGWIAASGTVLLVDAAHSSAGSAIPAMRGEGIPGQVLDPVVAAFASGTRWALISAIVALVIGFLAAFMVSKVGRGDVHN